MRDRQVFACHSIPLFGMCTEQMGKDRAIPMGSPTVHADKQDPRSQAENLNKAGWTYAHTEEAQEG